TNPRRSASTPSVAGRALELGDRLAVDALRLLGDGFPREMLLDALAAGAPHATAELGVLEHTPQRGRQVVRTPWRHEDAGLAVLDHLEDAADRGGDHRRLA